MYRLLLLTSFFSLLFAAPGQSQGGYPGLAPDRMDLPIGGAGPFLDTETGDFDGDGQPDLAVLRGAELRVLMGLGLTAVEFLAPSDHQAIDVLPGYGPGGADALVSVGSEGVGLLTWDEATVSFQRTVVTAHSDWLTSTDLEVVEGISTDSRLALLNGDGVTVSFVIAPTWYFNVYSVTATHGAILDMASFDFDGDDDEEIALMSASHVEVHKRVSGGAWTIMGAWSISNSIGVSLATGNANGQDWLGWLLNCPGDQKLGVLKDSEAAGLMSLGNRGMNRIATAPWNSDTNFDVLAGWTPSRRVAVFQDGQDWQMTDGPTFSDGSVVSWTGCHPTADLVTVPASNTPGMLNEGSLATPAGVDVDGDEDTDLLFPVQAEGLVSLTLNGCSDQDGIKPRISGGGEEDQSGNALPADVYINDISGNYHLIFSLDLAAPPAAANGIEVLLFRRQVDDPGDDVYDTIRVSQSGNLFTFPVGQAPVSVDVQLPLTDPSGAQLSASSGTAQELMDDDMFFWFQRYVIIDESDQVVRSFPAEIAGIQATGDWRTNLPAQEQQDRMLTWNGFSGLDVNSGLPAAPGEEDSGIVIGNGFVFSCLPDLTGPPRRGASLYLVNP